MTAKLRLAEAISFSHHRSGWGFALEALRPLMKPDGVLFDSFLESTFCWKLEDNVKNGVLPYREPWVGFIHNPPGIPKWHEYYSAPQCVFETPIWQQSMESCFGIFTFSDAMGQWLQKQVPVPIVSLIHPTSATDKVFDQRRFLSAEKPRIVQVGSWLRKMNSIALLKADHLQKICLICKQNGRAEFDLLVRRERENVADAAGADWSSVEIVDYLNPDSYDDLLSSSIVFIDLYDTTTNNAIIECIIRGTPVVCNRLPGLEELLGKDYPLFFTHLEDASSKISDMRFISEAADYLSLLPKKQFTPEYFRESVAENGIYKSLKD